MAEYVKDPCLTEIFAFWPEEDKETIQEYKNVKKSLIRVIYVCHGGGRG